MRVYLGGEDIQQVGLLLGGGESHRWKQYPLIEALVLSIGTDCVEGG